MVLGSTQPLTEMSTRSISWGQRRSVRKAETYHRPVPLSRNLGTLTSWNALGLPRPVMGLLYLFRVTELSYSIPVSDKNVLGRVNTYLCRYIIVSIYIHTNMISESLSPRMAHPQVADGGTSSSMEGRSGYNE